METRIFCARTIVTQAGDAPAAFATHGERIVAALRACFPMAEVVDFGVEHMRHADLSIDDPLQVEPSTLASFGVRATYAGAAEVWKRAA